MTVCCMHANQTTVYSILSLVYLSETSRHVFYVQDYRHNVRHECTRPGLTTIRCGPVWKHEPIGDQSVLGPLVFYRRRLSYPESYAVLANEDGDGEFTFIKQHNTKVILGDYARYVALSLRVSNSNQCIVVSYILMIRTLYCETFSRTISTTQPMRRNKEESSTCRKRFNQIAHCSPVVSRVITW